MRWDSIARDQGGMLTRAQLLAAGASSGSIWRALDVGHLRKTQFAGVFRVDGAPLDADAITWQFVLGTRAVLSYCSAAQIWDLPVVPDGLIHVTRCGRSRFAARAGLRVHRTLLRPAAITRVNGLDVTTRIETILDCSGWLPIAAARTFLDRALQQRWILPGDIQRRLDEEPGRWGNRRLRSMLAATMPGAEAESERRVHKILRAAGIAGWTGNLWVHLDGENYRLDIGFERERIAIEVEGWAFHRTKDRRDRDLAKLNALQRNGWRCLVFNWDHTGDAEYVLIQVRSLLAGDLRM